MVATADGIVRASLSPLARANPDEVAMWRSQYFADQLHQSLSDFARLVISMKIIAVPINSSNASVDDHTNPRWESFGDEKGVKVAIMTYSTIHTAIAPLVEHVLCADSVQVSIRIQPIHFLITNFTC